MLFFETQCINTTNITLNTHATEKLQDSSKAMSYHLEYQSKEDDSISNETLDRIHRKTTCNPETHLKTKMHHSQHQ